MDNSNITPEERADLSARSLEDDSGSGRKIVIGLIVGGLVIIALVAVAVYFLVQPTTDTARIRDIFIIFMALVSLLLGAVLILLVIQIARLTNLLQNEIKPILESTNETVSTLRGTTAFLSDNLVEPVIKLNEYVAAVSQVAGILSLGRRRQRDR